MRKILVILLFLSGNAYSQCKDTLLLPDKLYQCSLYAGGDEYNPVCGCDNITYRNECAAIHWGGLLYWTPNTICGNFDFDFNPTAISTNPGQFQAYIRNLTGQSIPIQIYIYDIYGKLEYTWFDVTQQDGFYPGYGQKLEIPAQYLHYGIYCLVVVVNGEKKSKKFGKVSPQ